MGDQMKKILLLLLLPVSANAANLNYDFSTSSDDDVDVQRHVITYRPSEYGIALSTTNFHTANKNYNSSGILLDTDAKYGDTKIEGNIGVGNIKHKNYLLGDINLTHTIKNNISVSTGIYGDLLDGNRALEQKISFKGINGSLEWESDTIGAQVGFKKTKFSDNNDQKGPFVKLWYQLHDGINVYGFVKRHTNSIQTATYYSPESYKRSGVGISFKRWTDIGRISGFIEKSNIATNTSFERAMAWRVQYEKKIDNLNFIVSTGRDFGSDSGFNYRYTNFSVQYNF